ncbi:hypothetical protein QUC32_23060 [Novosphingobium resinovorum]|uniref:hypothetical protein n=1 Tax=Novosphingobium TaxID=165696 RepID=UPI001B3C6BC5|nr:MULTISPECIES: hypothetical protein [Novosphingobium]MBF7012531.1 hypothetical protein [Novosphingobium sp. HR1a]WJM27265.1 hypothetical protein QUC32_23060 [Novosphingobium resinovorum]
MTEDQITRAATLVFARQEVRKLFRDCMAVTITAKDAAGKSISIPCDPHMTKAVLNGADASLSDRLGKMGVSEA